MPAACWAAGIRMRPTGWRTFLPPPGRRSAGSRTIQRNFAGAGLEQISGFLCWRWRLNALDYVPRESDNPGVLVPRSGDGPALLLDETDRTISSCMSPARRSSKLKSGACHRLAPSAWIGVYPEGANFVVLSDQHVGRLRMKQVPSAIGNRHRQNADTCGAYDRAHRVDVRDLRRDPTCQRQRQEHDHEGRRRSRWPGYQDDGQPGEDGAPPGTPRRQLAHRGAEKPARRA